MRHQEHAIQSACVRWFELQYKKKHLLHAIPNGAKLPGSGIARARAGKRLKDEGLLPGAADLFLAVPSGSRCGLYIEMKTTRGSQSEAQKEFEARAVAGGYGYALARSLTEFMEIVRTYLETGEY